MKIKCVNNTGEALRGYEYKSLRKDILGRFGATGYTEYNELVIGKEYLVMGVVVFETYSGYLIDDNGFISVCPCQLFEIIDDKLSSNWHFRLIPKDEDIYPFIQALFGYEEFCSDKKSYENLIINKDQQAQGIYFRNKIEFETLYRDTELG